MTLVPPTPGATALDDVAEVDERFRAHLRSAVAGPLAEALHRYRDALAGILAESEARLRTPDAAGPADAEARRVTADGFARLFRSGPLDGADPARQELIRRWDAVPGLHPELPETVTAPPVGSGARAPAPVRPGPTRRLLASLSRSAERVVPAGPLARLYLALLSERLETAFVRAMSLDSVALSGLRGQLHAHVGVRRDAPADLRDVAATARREIEDTVEAVADEYGSALAAAALRVDDAAARPLAERAADRRARLLDDWRSFENGLRATIRSEAVLARALASMDAATTRAATDLADTLDRIARGPLARLAGELGRAADQVPERLADGLRANEVEALRHDVDALFPVELEDLSARLESEIGGVIDRYLEELAAVVETVPDELRVSEERIPRIPERPRALELRDAPVDELLRAACEGTIPRWIEREAATLGPELAAVDRELDRIRKATDFQIRAPIRGGFRHEEAVTLIVEGLEGARAQVDELIEAGLDPVERFITELERLGAEEAGNARSAVSERSFLRMRTEIAEEEAARRLTTSVQWGRQLGAAGLRIARSGWAAGRWTYDRIREWSRRQLGTGTLARDEMLESLEASLLNDDLGILIPPLYRQLMAVDQDVPWDELLVPRDEEIGILERALDRWRRGEASSLVVVGEKGSGKSTLLRMARSAFDDLEVRTVELERTLRDPGELYRAVADGLGLDVEDRTGLVRALRESGPAAVVLEDANQMFLRGLGGFRTVESFLELMSETRQAVFWVITADEYAWRYLDRVLATGSYFTHAINTTNLSPEGLERAIMARHEVSGLSLRFDLPDRADGLGRWTRRLRRVPQSELSRREAQRTLFFRDLNQIAEGNIFLALFYWLRSVDRVENHTLVLRRPATIDLEFLERLPLPSLHTIAGIILHTGLTPDEHSHVFQLDPAESRLQLAALADSHLIFRSASGEYRVNKVLYRPLTRLLRAKNIF